MEPKETLEQLVLILQPVPVAVPVVVMVHHQVMLTVDNNKLVQGNAQMPVISLVHMHMSG